MFTNLFAPLAMRISAAIIAALVLALGITIWRADTISADREALRNDLAVSNARHAVTTASLNTLQAELAEMVAAGELRAERVSIARARVHGDTKPLRDQAAAVEAGTLDPRDVEGL